MRSRRTLAHAVVVLAFAVCCGPRGQTGPRANTGEEQSGPGSAPSAPEPRGVVADAPDDGVDSAAVEAAQMHASPVTPDLCKQYSLAGYGDVSPFRCSLCEKGMLAPNCPTARACVCPTARACVHRASTPLLYRNDWDHSWRVFADGRGKSPCTNGPRFPDELEVVLAEEGLSEADISCTIVSWIPEIAGAVDGWMRVRVPDADGRAAPAAISPLDVEDALYRARARFSEPHARMLRDERHDPVFSKLERSKMTSSTFLQPTLRIVEDYVSRRFDVVKQMRLFVLFSPESAKVFVLDGSFMVSADDAPENGMIDFERRQASILVPWLQSIGVSDVRFSLLDACLVPDELGGRHWYRVSFPAKNGAAPRARAPSR